MKFCKSKGIKKIEQPDKESQENTDEIYNINPSNFTKKIRIAGKNLRWFENYLQDRKLKLQ